MYNRSKFVNTLIIKLLQRIISILIHLILLKNPDFGFAI